MQKNALEIFEPAKLRYYSEYDNINHYELAEPYEKAMSPIFTHFRNSPADSVRHFRKVLLWTTYARVVDFFEWDSATDKVTLTKHRDPSKRYKGFAEKIKYVLKHYATKSKIKKYMEKTMFNLNGLQVNPSKFYDEIYRLLKKDIKKAR